MTVEELLKLGSNQLRDKTSSADLDAEVLLSFVLKRPKEYLFTHWDEVVKKPQTAQYLKLVKQRQKNVPVAYLIQSREFYKFPLFVNKHVLIPQPRTEQVVESALDKLKGKKHLKILDVGTGSGAIIIALAKLLKEPTNKYFASDISGNALAVAKRNAKFHKVSVNFKKSDLLKAWSKNFDVILANLPYLAKVTDSEAKHEPKRALLAKQGGNELYLKLLKQLSARPPKYLFIEVHDQKQKRFLEKSRARQLLKTKIEIISK